MAMKQNQFAIMEWTSDGNKMSVHHLKYIADPLKSWNNYEVGDRGTATFPGTGDTLWEFVIHAVGASRKDLNDQLKEILQQEKLRFQGEKGTSSEKKARDASATSRSPGKNKKETTRTGITKEKKDQNDKQRKADGIQQKRMEKQQEISAMKEQAKNMEFAKSKADTLSSNSVDDDVEEISTEDVNELPVLTYEQRARVSRMENVKFMNKELGPFLESHRRKRPTPKKSARRQDDDPDYDVEKDCLSSDNNDFDTETVADNTENSSTTSKSKQNVAASGDSEAMVETISVVEMESPAKRSRLDIQLSENCACENCPYKKEAENLKRQLDALHMKISRVDPKDFDCQAGMHTPEVAKANKLVELMPNSHIYITQAQFASVKCGINSRTKLATRLLRCFHNRDELLCLKSYTNVKKEIRETIESCAVGMKLEENALPPTTVNKVKKALSNHVLELTREKRNRSASKQKPSTEQEINADTEKQD